MIGMLTGRVESVETDTALIDVGGVGYEVRMSATDLSRLHAGQDTRVFTYMNLSQDAITLHGFLDRDAKKTFLQLIKVSGIGPKVAQSLLSTLTPSQLAHAIADNDATALAKAPGLGKKGAQKIILELKGSIDLSQIEGASAQAATSKSPVDTGTEQVDNGALVGVAGHQGSQRRRTDFAWLASAGRPAGRCRGLRRKRHSHAACHRRCAACATSGFGADG